MTTVGVKGLMQHAVYFFVQMILSPFFLVRFPVVFDTHTLESVMSVANCSAVRRGAVISPIIATATGSRMMMIMSQYLTSCLSVCH